MKRKKLICFDLNKTLIEENTWYNLNLAMGMTPSEDAKLCKLYENRKITYNKWQKELEKIYIKSGKATKENILTEIYKYTYNNGAKEIVRYLKNKGYIVILISGSINLLVERVSKELSIKYYYSNNEFEFDKRGYLRRIICLGNDKTTKVIQLKNICKKLQLSLDDCICIGDGDNDTELFKKSKGITFRNSAIEKYAWKVINDLNDLKSIL